MNTLLEQALDRIRAVPRGIQGDISRLFARFAEDRRPLHRLSPEEEAELSAGDAKFSRCAFCEDDDPADRMTSYRL